MSLFTALGGVVAFVLSLVMTERFRHYALARGILDVPNARSSHVVPTPRGGGVAIVLAALVIFSLLPILHELPWSTALGLVSAGALAGLTGYADDKWHATVGWRLLGQFASAACVLWFIGFAPVSMALQLPDAAAWFGAVIAVLYLVWMLNLTNFMDGIDGIASVEVIAVCAGTALCAVAGAPGATEASINTVVCVSLILASATAGFLRWNWPPATIFMGDAGSGFLGIMMGALALVAGGAWPALFWSCLILCGVFVVDATGTLLRRVARGERFYQAHRTHAYQRAAGRWGHKPVTMGVAILTMAWLLPWAVLASRGSLHGLVAMAIAWVPLAGVALLLRAGAPA